MLLSLLLILIEVILSQFAGSTCTLYEKNNKLSAFVSTDDEDIASVDVASLKQGYAGLVTLVLEAVKMDSDSPTIRYQVNWLINHSLKSLPINPSTPKPA